MQLSHDDGFDGFAAGRAAISLPSQFFVELLPMIDDEAELRVTLAALHALSVLKGPLRAVTVTRLAADQALRRSLRHCGGSDALIPALKRAAVRGGLRLLPLDDGGILCFANDAPGRRSFDRVRTGARGSRQDSRSPRLRPSPPSGASLLRRMSTSPRSA